MSWFGTLVNKHSLAATALVTSLIVTGLLPAAPAGATDGQPSPSDEASSAVESAQSGETTSADLGVAIDTLNKSVLPAVTGAQDTAPAEGANEAVDSTQSWCPSLAWEANPLGFTGQGEYAGNQVEVYAAGDAQFDTDPGDVAVFVKGDLTVGDDETYLDSVDPSDAPYVTFDSELGALNAALEALQKQPSGKVSLDGETFTLTGDGQSPVQVFNISAEQAPALANADTVLNLTSIPGEVGDLQSTVILNVEGSDVTTVHQNLQLNINGLNVDADEDQDKWANLTQHLMWRFPQADAVVIGDQTDMDDEADYNFAGTIYAAKEGTDLTVNTPTNGRVLSNGDLDMTAAIPEAGLAAAPLILPDVSACEVKAPVAGNLPAPPAEGGNRAANQITMATYISNQRVDPASGATGPVVTQSGFHGYKGFAYNGAPASQCDSSGAGQQPLAVTTSPGGPNLTSQSVCDTWAQKVGGIHTWNLDWNKGGSEVQFKPYLDWGTLNHQANLYSLGFRRVVCEYPGQTVIAENTTLKGSGFNGYDPSGGWTQGLANAPMLTLRQGQSGGCRFYIDKTGRFDVRKEVYLDGELTRIDRNFQVDMDVWDRDNGPRIQGKTWQVNGNGEAVKELAGDPSANNDKDEAGMPFPAGATAQFTEKNPPQTITYGGETYEYLRTAYVNREPTVPYSYDYVDGFHDAAQTIVRNYYKKKAGNFEVKKEIDGVASQDLSYFNNLQFKVKATIYDKDNQNKQIGSEEFTVTPTGGWKLSGDYPVGSKVVLEELSHPTWGDYEWSGVTFSEGNTSLTNGVFYITNDKEERNPGHSITVTNSYKTERPVYVKKEIQCSNCSSAEKNELEQALASSSFDVKVDVNCDKTSLGNELVHVPGNGSTVSTSKSYAETVGGKRCHAVAVENQPTNTPDGFIFTSSKEGGPSYVDQNSSSNPLVVTNYYKKFTPQLTVCKDVENVPSSVVGSRRFDINVSLSGSSKKLQLNDNDCESFDVPMGTQVQISEGSVPDIPNYVFKGKTITFGRWGTGGNAESFTMKENAHVFVTNTYEGSAGGFNATKDIQGVAPADMTKFMEDLQKTPGRDSFYLKATIKEPSGGTSTEYMWVSKGKLTASDYQYPIGSTVTLNEESTYQGAVGDYDWVSTSYQPESFTITSEGWPSNASITVVNHYEKTKMGPFYMKKEITCSNCNAAELTELKSALANQTFSVQSSVICDKEYLDEIQVPLKGDGTVYKSQKEYPLKKGDSRCGLMAVETAPVPTAAGFQWERATDSVDRLDEMSPTKPMVITNQYKKLPLEMESGSITFQKKVTTDGGGESNGSDWELKLVPVTKDVTVSSTNPSTKKTGTDGKITWGLQVPKGTTKATFKISETNQGNFTLKKLVCDGKTITVDSSMTGSGYQIELPVKATGVVCTFTNDQPKPPAETGSAKIQVQKYTCDAGKCTVAQGTRANWQVSYSNATNATPAASSGSKATGTSGDGAVWDVTLTNKDVSGSFKVSETMQNGYEFDNMQCSVGSGSAKSYKLTDAVPLEDGKTTKCTLFNKTTAVPVSTTVEYDTRWVVSGNHKTFTPNNYTNAELLAKGWPSQTIEPRYSANGGGSYSYWPANPQPGNWGASQEMTAGSFVLFGANTKNTGTQARDALPEGCSWNPVSGGKAHKLVRDEAGVEQDLYNFKPGDTPTKQEVKQGTNRFVLVNYVTCEDTSAPAKAYVQVEKEWWKDGGLMPGGATAGGKASVTIKVNGTTVTPGSKVEVDPGASVTVEETAWTVPAGTGGLKTHVQVDGKSTQGTKVTITAPAAGNTTTVKVVNDVYTALACDADTSTGLKTTITPANGTQEEGKNVTFTVTVRDTAGNPVPGVWVQLPVTPGPTYAAKETNSDGQVSWSIGATFAPGTYTVSAKIVSNDGAGVGLEVGGSRTCTSTSATWKADAKPTPGSTTVYVKKYECTSDASQCGMVNGSPKDGKATATSIAGWPVTVKAEGGYTTVDSKSSSTKNTTVSGQTWGVAWSDGSGQVSFSEGAPSGKENYTFQGMYCYDGNSGNTSTLQSVTGTLNSKTFNVPADKNLDCYLFNKEPAPDKINITVNKEWVITGDHKTYTVGTHKHGSAVGQLLGGNGRVGFGDDSSQDYPWGSTVQGISGSKVKVGERVSIPADCEWNPQSDGKATYVKSVQDNNGVYIDGSSSITYGSWPGIKSDRTFTITNYITCKQPTTPPAETGKLTVTKKWVDEDGKLLDADGARVTVTVKGKDNYIKQQGIDGNRLFSLSDVPVGEVTVSENATTATAPTGYELVEGSTTIDGKKTTSQKFDFDGKDKTVNIVNTAKVSAPTVPVPACYDYGTWNVEGAAIKVTPSTQTVGSTVSVTGTIQTQAGAAISGAKVQLRVNGSIVGAEMTTDASGMVTWNNITNSTAGTVKYTLWVVSIPGSTDYKNFACDHASVVWTTPPQKDYAHVQITKYLSPGAMSGTNWDLQAVVGANASTGKGIYDITHKAGGWANTGSKEGIADWKVYFSSGTSTELTIAEENRNGYRLKSGSCTVWDASDNQVSGSPFTVTPTTGTAEGEWTFKLPVQISKGYDVLCDLTNEEYTPTTQYNVTVTKKWMVQGGGELTSYANKNATVAVTGGTFGKLGESFKVDDGTTVTVKETGYAAPDGYEFVGLTIGGDSKNLNEAYSTKVTGNKTIEVVNTVKAKDPGKASVTVNKTWVVSGTNKEYAGTHKHDSDIGRKLGGNGKVAFGDPASPWVPVDWGNAAQVTPLDGNGKLPWVHVSETVELPTGCEWENQSTKDKPIKVVRAGGSSESWMSPGSSLVWKDLTGDQTFNVTNYIKCTEPAEQEVQVWKKACDSEGTNCKDLRWRLGMELDSKTSKDVTFRANSGGLVGDNGGDFKRYWIKGPKDTDAYLNVWEDGPADTTPAQYRDYIFHSMTCAYVEGTPPGEKTIFFEKAGGSLSAQSKAQIKVKAGYKFNCTVRNVPPAPTCAVTSVKIDASSVAGSKEVGDQFIVKATVQPSGQQPRLKLVPKDSNSLTVSSAIATGPNYQWQVTSNKVGTHGFDIVIVDSSGNVLGECDGVKASGELTFTEKAGPGLSCGNSIATVSPASQLVGRQARFEIHAKDDQNNTIQGANITIKAKSGLSGLFQDTAGNSNNGPTWETTLVYGNTASEYRYTSIGSSKEQSVDFKAVIEYGGKSCEISLPVTWKEQDVQELDCSILGSRLTSDNRTLWVGEEVELWYQARSSVNTLVNADVTIKVKNQDSLYPAGPWTGVADFKQKVQSTKKQKVKFEATATDYKGNKCENDLTIEWVEHPVQMDVQWQYLDGDGNLTSLGTTGNDGTLTSEQLVNTVGVQAVSWGQTWTSKASLKHEDTPGSFTDVDLVNWKTGISKDGIGKYYKRGEKVVMRADTEAKADPDNSTDCKLVSSKVVKAGSDNVSNSPDFATNFDAKYENKVGNPTAVRKFVVENTVTCPGAVQMESKWFYNPGVDGSGRQLDLVDLGKDNQDTVDAATISSVAGLNEGVVYGQRWTVEPKIGASTTAGAGDHSAQWGVPKTDLGNGALFPNKELHVGIAASQDDDEDSSTCTAVSTLVRNNEDDLDPPHNLTTDPNHPTEFTPVGAMQLDKYHVETAVTCFGGVEWEKVSDEGEALTGSVWDIVDADGVSVRSGIVGIGCDDDGVGGESCSNQFLVTGLPLGNYTLVEASAPEGYALIKNPIPFTVEGDPAVVDLGEIENELEFKPTGPTLPHAGGMSTTIFLVVAGISLTGAVVFGPFSKRRQGRHAQ